VGRTQGKQLPISGRKEVTMRTTQTTAMRGVNSLYTGDEGAADRAEPPKGHRCLLADLMKIRQGISLRFELDTVGCGVGKRWAMLHVPAGTAYAVWMGLALTGGTSRARIRSAARRSASSRARRAPITQLSQG
jgi:hypothetical protein